MNLVIGRKPVLEAIKFTDELDRIYFLFGQKGDIVNEIKSLARKKEIKVSEISYEKFKSLCKNLNTQGVIAIKKFFKTFSVEELINSSLKKNFPLLLILDSIQDPHNIGAILRTAECCGVDGVILTQYNSAPITETVVKISTGATEHLKICKIENLNSAIHLLKKNGFWIIGSSLENSKNYLEVDYKIPLALIVGNEDKGIRQLTKKSCDFLVEIPMYGKIQSLNVSVATGILLFEILRQRN